MRKHAFVPGPVGALEDRIALSSGPRFTPFGAAILTGRAFGKATAQINGAFARFATKGMDYGRLNADLLKAASLIPYNRRDGLAAALLSEVATMQSNIAFGSPRPVIAAVQAAQADLNDFVSQEVAFGNVVIR
jgi:hypothetical protein